jgi:carbonic anhydrase/acetyltransferase-like protein (isoleucine patch superfamily)
VLLAAGSTTVEGQRLESGWLWAGRPARPLSRLDDAKRAMMAVIIEQYCGYADDFRRLQSSLG